MSQIGNVVLNDKVDAAITYTPSVKDSLLVKYTDSTTSVTRPALANTVSVGMRSPKSGVSRKVTLKVVMPYDSTGLNGVVKTEALTAFIDFVIPETATGDDIENLCYFASGACLEAQFTDAIKNGNFPY